MIIESGFIILGGFLLLVLKLPRRTLLRAWSGPRKMDATKFGSLTSWR